MTDFHAAREIAHGAGVAAPSTTELVELADAPGRTLATDLVATAPLPGFASAAMDGWVVAGDGPWMLGDAIKAGDDIPTERLAIGDARPISTGAPLPPGAARVIRSERGEVSGSTLAEVEPDSRRHIREAGEEAAPGDVLVEAGLPLTPPRIALAAAAGYDVIPVIVPPAVRLLVLGDEVIDRGTPDPGPRARCLLAVAARRSRRAGHPPARPGRRFARGHDRRVPGHRRAAARHHGRERPRVRPTTCGRACTRSVPSCCSTASGCDRGTRSCWRGWSRAPWC